MFIFQWIWYSNVFICFFWLRKGSSIKYVCSWWRDGRSSKMRTATNRGKGCHVSYVNAHLHFSCFWQQFCLIVSCFICRNLTLTFFRKRCFCQKRLFFSNKINFRRKFFYLKSSLRTKASQNSFNFNQIFLDILYILVWYLTLKKACAT